MNCPICKKGMLIEGTNGFACNHFVSMEDKCDFKIYPTYFGKSIDKKMLNALVEKGETELLDDLTTKDGQIFSGKLKIEDGYIKLSKESKKLQTPCPCCGSEILSTNKAFICSEYFNDKSCLLYINRTVAGYTITDELAESIFGGKATPIIDDFSSRTGKDFSAKLSLAKKETESNDFFCFDLDFKLAECPKCGGDIVSNTKAYGCSNFNKQPKCDFVLWKSISGRQTSSNELLELLESGTTKVLTGFKSKSGEMYNGKLTLSQDFKVKIV